MSVLDKVADILSGEPARAIGYAGAALLYVAAKVSGTIPDVSVDEALVQATAFVVGVAAVVETIRQFVSPASKSVRIDGPDAE